jgi:hypothetical protein
VDIVAATELADLEAEFYENGGGYSGKGKGGRGQLEVCVIPVAVRVICAHLSA